MPVREGQWHLLGYRIDRKNPSIFAQLCDKFDSVVLSEDLSQLKLEALSEQDRSLLIARIMLTPPSTLQYKSWTEEDRFHYNLSRLIGLSKSKKTVEEHFHDIVKSKHRFHLQHKELAFKDLENLDIIELSDEQFVALKNQIKCKVSRKRTDVNEEYRRIHNALYAKYIYNRKVSDQELRQTLSETQQHMLRTLTKDGLQARFSQLEQIDPKDLDERDFERYCQFLRFTEPFMQGKDRYAEQRTPVQELHTKLHFAYLKYRELSVSELKKKLSNSYRAWRAPYVEAEEMEIAQAYQKECEQWAEQTRLEQVRLWKEEQQKRKQEEEEMSEWVDAVHEEQVMQCNKRKREPEESEKRKRSKNHAIVSEEVLPDGRKKQKLANETVVFLLPSGEVQRYTKAGNISAKKGNNTVSLRHHSEAYIQRRMHVIEQMTGEKHSLVIPPDRRKEFGNLFHGRTAKTKLKVMENGKQYVFENKGPEFLEKRRKVVEAITGAASLEIPPEKKGEYVSMFTKLYPEHQPADKDHYHDQRHWQLMNLQRLNPEYENQYREIVKQRNDKYKDRDRGDSEASTSRAVRQEITANFDSLLNDTLKLTFE